MNSPRAALRAILITAALCGAGCGHGADTGVEAISGGTMGTTYHIKYVPPPTNAASREVIETGINRILARIDQEMSTYREDSEISRFNTANTTDWVEVSAAFVKVVEESLRISRLSDGAFDITVGPLVNLWGFGPVANEQNVPGDAAIATAKARIGYQKLHTRKQPPALRKDERGLYVDLNAIAPGYGVDELAQYLESEGIRSYVVELGGEVFAKGLKPGGGLWRLAIEKPLTGERAVQEVLALDGLGLSTSGDYREYFEKDGHRYSHTIDPQSGRPVSHTLASVSVIAPTTMTADGLATALMVLGPEAGFRLAEREQVPALFIVRAKSGFEERATLLFARYRVH